MKPQLASGLEANGSSYGSNSDDERCVRVDTNKQVAAKALDSMMHAGQTSKAQLAYQHTSIRNQQIRRRA